MPVEITCHRCNRIVTVDKKALPNNIDKLGSSETFKIFCNFCGPRGVGKIPDICYFCKKRAMKRDPKDNVLFCSACYFTESGMRKCPRCGHVQDPNSRYCDCGKELLSEKRGNYFLRNL